MTDEPYHSLPPVVNAITGFCIAFALILVPFVAITRVKLENKVDCSANKTNCKTNNPPIK